MAMKSPSHPGGIIRAFIEDEDVGLTITAAAEHLGVTRQTLNNLVNEKSGVSAEMALRLEKMGWSTAEHWLQMQMNYDLARTRARSDSIVVRAFVR